jgi:hypothetical protein
VIILCSVLGSGGFWAYLQKRNTNNNASTRLMMGLAYDKITTLGLHYIDRGYITKDEFEELQKYFYDPYKALGGNGIAERIWMEVRNLPFHSHKHHDAIFTNERYIPNVPVISSIGGRQEAAVE